MTDVARSRDRNTDIFLYSRGKISFPALGLMSVVTHIVVTDKRAACVHREHFGTGLLQYSGSLACTVGSDTVFCEVTALKLYDTGKCIITVFLIDLLDYFPRKSGRVLNRIAAILIRSLVECRAEELRRKICVGHMEFNTIRSRCLDNFRRLEELLLKIMNLFC